MYSTIFQFVNHFHLNICDFTSLKHFLLTITNLLFVKIDPMVMLATSISPASRVLPVFANTAMAMTYMTSQLPGLARLLVRLQTKWKRCRL